MLQEQCPAQGRAVPCGKCYHCRKTRLKQCCLSPIIPAGRQIGGGLPRQVRPQNGAEWEPLEEQGDWEQQELVEGNLSVEEGEEEQPAQQREHTVHAQAGLETGSASQRFRQDTHQLLFTSSYEYARRQHISNLTFQLRHFAATRDWSRLAGVVATLMASDRAENLSDTWMFRHPGSRARLTEALEAGWLLLQQQPGALSYEQTLRFMKQWAAYQLVPAGKEAVYLQLAQFSRAQGRVTDAWDFLGAQTFSTAATEGERRAIMVAIRQDAWAETMQRAAALLSAPAQPYGSPNKHRRSGPYRSGAWQLWQHDARVWAHAGRMAKELHQDAVEICQSMLDQHLEVGHIAQLMIQLHLAAGDAPCGLATARLLQQHAPLDVDAVGRLVLLLTAQAAPQCADLLDQHLQQEHQAADALPSKAAPEAADFCCQLLAADPSSHAAAVALLALHEQQPMVAAQLAAGCCSYLDGQPPSWLPPLLELRVWQHLASTIVQAAATVVDRGKQLQDLQRRWQALLPHSLCEVQQQLHGSEVHSRLACQCWQQLQELTIAAAEAERSLQDAVCVYRHCGTVMEGRLWWKDAHLLTQPASTVLASLANGSAYPASLLALATVNAFLHPLWQQRLIQNWRASGGTSGLPRIMQNLMTHHTAAALAQAGYRQEAEALRVGAKLCRQAAAVAARQERTGSGGLVSLPRQRADLLRAS